MRPRQDNASAESGLELISADRIRPEAVDWIWREHLAAGKLTVLAGAPGTGKTTIAIMLAATISAGGTWPDGSKAEPGTVVIWSGEDDPADTLVPRLMVAGANLSNVHFIESVRIEGQRRAFDPATDAAQLIAALTEVPNRRLLIIDPIAAAVAGDSHKNSEVRRALHPLIDVVRMIDCALLGITHFSKGTSGRDPIERITGSLAFGALARIVLVAAKARAPESGVEPPRLLLRAKSNLGRDHGGYQYELHESPIAAGSPIQASHIVWRGTVDGSARTLLAQAEDQATTGPSAVEEAKEFLTEVLSDGPIAANDVYQRSAAAGIARPTLRRAQSALQIKPHKVGMKAGWHWELPRRCSNSSEDAQAESVSTFELLQEGNNVETH